MYSVKHNKHISNHAYENLHFTMPIWWNNKESVKFNSSLNEIIPFCIYFLKTFNGYSFVIAVLDTWHNSASIVWSKISISFITKIIFLLNISCCCQPHWHRHQLWKENHFHFYKTWRVALRICLTSHSIKKSFF